MGPCSGMVKQAGSIPAPEPMTELVSSKPIITMQKFAKFMFWVVVFPVLMAMFYMGVYQLFVALGATSGGLVLYYIFVTLTSIGIVVYGLTEVVVN